MAGGLCGLASCGRAVAAAIGGVALNVRHFGAVGDGLANDTGAFARALAASRTIYAPAGSYLVDTIVLPAGSRLATDGRATRFRQRKGIEQEIRILNVIGSDVVIGDCTVEGNIATDSGEQRHGVFIGATRATGPISNVRVGNIDGMNLRGDAVYVGASDGASLTTVKVGNVRASNVLRNVVSVVGGRHISIGHITGVNVGYTHLDIEPDESNGPVQDCSVASVHGGFAQIAGQSASAYVDEIHIGVLDLKPPVERSLPAYPPGLRRTNALEVRNFRSIEIGRFVAKGFTGAAVLQVWDRDSLPDQYLYIVDAEFINCARGPGSRAYVQGSRSATHVRIDRLNVALPRSGIDVLRDCKSARIGSLATKLPTGTRLIADSNSIIAPLAYAAAAAGGTFAFLRLGQYLWR